MYTMFPFTWNVACLVFLVRQAYIHEVNVVRYARRSLLQNKHLTVLNSTSTPKILHLV